MIVKMIKNLESKMEKMQESINKDLEELNNISDHRTGKGQFSSQFPRRILKNVLAIGQLHHLAY